MITRLIKDLKKLLRSWIGSKQTRFRETLVCHFSEGCLLNWH